MFDQINSFCIVYMANLKLEKSIFYFNSCPNWNISIYNKMISLLMGNFYYFVSQYQIMKCMDFSKSQYICILQ